MSVLQEMEPKKVFEFFEALTRIPHTSGNTGAVSAYLKDFADQRGLRSIRDEADNVIIWKDGSRGKEQAPTVILQGHMDMVGDKKTGSKHDFLKDPLRISVDGDFIHAEDTTLGGDDGIAVAYMLAILDDESIVHPPLETVFTTGEEIGLIGASALDTSVLKGRLMLNLDSESEGIFTCGCAGGLTETTALPLTYEASEGVPVLIRMDGLKGGHSGQMINEGRGNAAKLIARFLYELKGNVPYRLISLEGGVKDNAIPFSSKAEILTEKEDAEKILDAAENYEKTLRTEYAGTDDGVTVRASVKTIQAKRVMSDDCRDRILTQMMNMPYGVIKMSRQIEGLVETSTNVGVMTIKEDQFTTVSSCRSSLVSERDDVQHAIESLALQLGGKSTVGGAYPPWVYQPDSQLRRTACDTYRELFGKEPVVDVIHAGLECGLFYDRMPGLDAISYGPDMQDIHTFNEKLSVSSVRRVWELTLKILEKIQ